MQDDLYKEDEFFIEILNSGDRKRQCEYRNAVIKAIIAMDKAKDDGSVADALNEVFQRQDLTQRVARRVYNFFKTVTILLLADLIAFLVLRLYLFQNYNQGTMAEWMLQSFSVYCGDGSTGRIVIRSIALAFCFFYTFFAKACLNSAIAKAADGYIVSIPMEPTDLDEKIVSSITGNTYPALVAKRDALDGVLWGGIES